MNLTAVFVETSEGYKAYVEELSGAEAGGASLEEARTQLQSVVRQLFETNRSLAEGMLISSQLPFCKEPILV